MIYIIVFDVSQVVLNFATKKVVNLIVYDMIRIGDGQCQHGSKKIGRLGSNGS